MSSEINKIRDLCVGPSQWGGEQVVGWEDILSGEQLVRWMGVQGQTCSVRSRSSIVNSIREQPQYNHLEHGLPESEMCKERGEGGEGEAFEGGETISD